MAIDASKDDIFLYGFDKVLYRLIEVPIEEINPLIYDSIRGAVNPALLNSGAIASDLEISGGGNIRQGQTAYNTGIGFWLGDVNGSPMLSIGNPDGNHLTFDGNKVTISGDIALNTIRVYRITSGTGDTYWADDAGESTQSGTYVKKKEFTFGTDWPSQTQIKYYYNYWIDTAIGTTWAKLLKSGVLIDVEHTTQTVAAKEVSGTTTISPGDTLSLWIKEDGDIEDAFCGTFRILGVNTPTSYTITTTT